jgi:DNA-directed RNA polymerase specialized sigma24 family protein
VSEASPYLARALAERDEIVGRAVGELPDGERTLILLHYVAGIPLAQLAGAWERDPATLTRWHHRALKRLRRSLKRAGVASYKDI